jgi:hypothetical protein
VTLPSPRSPSPSPSSAPPLLSQSATIAVSVISALVGLAAIAAGTVILMRRRAITLTNARANADARRRRRAAKKADFAAAEAAAASWGAGARDASPRSRSNTVLNEIEGEAAAFQSRTNPLFEQQQQQQQQQRAPRGGAAAAAGDEAGEWEAPRVSPSARRAGAMPPGALVQGRAGPLVRTVQIASPVD